MPLFLSKPCQYALRALVYIVAESDGENMLIRDIAGRLGIPYHVLAKLFQNLVRKGILASFKGPTGGMLLARDPNDIRLIEIVEAVDGTGFLSGCFMGIDKCSDSNPCPLHYDWVGIRKEIVRMLSSQSLYDFAEDVKHEKTHLVKAK